MALKTTKKITYTGLSQIGNATVERYTANIDTEDPDNLTISAMQVNKTLYKANRAECREDKAAFEEMVYAIQDEMLAEETIDNTTVEDVAGGNNR